MSRADYDPDKMVCTVVWCDCETTHVEQATVRMPRKWHGDHNRREDIIAKVINAAERARQACMKQ